MDTDQHGQRPAGEWTGWQRNSMLKHRMLAVSFDSQQAHLGDCSSRENDGKMDSSVHLGNVRCEGDTMEPKS